MQHPQPKKFAWAIIGAGPAGIASIGLLLEQGVNAQDIAWIDPSFTVGDFGQHWSEVYSNTSVELFLRFLNEIKPFHYHQRSKTFPIDALPTEDCCQLKEMTIPLQWVTDYLCEQVTRIPGYVNQLHVDNGSWQLSLNKQVIQAEKVILATGANPKSLSFKDAEEISIYNALNPEKLKQAIEHNDSIAVFGSSHSSMIIMKNLLDCGVNKIINFYLTPHRYAVKMDGWTLYDNTGLKAHTAQWVRQNISQQCDPRIQRVLSNEENIKSYFGLCNKAIYPVGFKARSPHINGIQTENYDANTGIIAPGLFGAGIAFPLLKTDPFGGKEMSVGLYKFMKDIRSVMPLWLRYDL